MKFRILRLIRVRCRFAVGRNDAEREFGHDGISFVFSWFSL